MRTDDELVEASRRGEHAAFGELVSRYQAVVCAVSYSSTGDRSISEDVAQDTFVAAWQTLDRLRDTMALVPWLCGIARNIGRKARKRSRPDKRVELDDDVAGASTPFDDTAQAEVERVVTRALGKVPIACRDVLVLYYRESQSIRDVAVALGISEEAVMQRLSRGRRYLAAEVTEVVEHSLAGRRRRRDLVAAVLASIAAITLPSRVDASPSKGSTMLKLSLAASALVATGTGAYFLPRHRHRTSPPAVAAALHYGRKDVHPHLPMPRTLLAPAQRAQVVDDLARLPDDSEVVIGVDVSQLRSTAVWQRFVAPKLEHLSALQDLRANCGLDPVASAESIAVGIKGINSGGVSGALVIRGLDKARTLTCLADHPYDGLAIDGDTGVFGEANEQVGFAFVDTRTLVVVVGAGAGTAEALGRVVAGGGHLEGSPAFADLFQHIHSEDTMWLVVAPSVPFPETSEAVARQHAGEKLDLSAVYGSIDVSDAVVLDARLRLGSPAKAAFWVDQIKQTLAEPAAQLVIDHFFDAVDVTADDTDVRIDAAAAAEQLDALSAMVPITNTTDTADDDNDNGSGTPGLTIDVSVSTK